MSNPDQHSQLRSGGVRFSLFAGLGWTGLAGLVCGAGGMGCAEKESWSGWGEDVRDDVVRQGAREEKRTEEEKNGWRVPASTQGAK